MKNLLYTAALGLLIVGCSKPTIEDEGIFIPEVDATVQGEDETTSSNTNTTTTDGTATATTTTGDTTTPPKDDSNTDNCDSTYVFEDCSFVNDYTYFYGKLAVRDGYTLRHDESTYINYYEQARDAIEVNENFTNVLNRFPVIIEDNTEAGSYSFAGTCGTSWHDSHTMTDAVIGTLVHEWGHVWHSNLNQCILERIQDAFNNQRRLYEEGNGYEQILTNVGTKENPRFIWVDQYPYQLSNDGEYMACNIAAYFGRLDGAGTIENLQEQDPVIYELITELLN